jgi:hypothetical protein
MKSGNGSEARNGLLHEYEKLLKKLATWRLNTILYRWMNIFMFLICKLLVPTGALIIAINMISIVWDKPLINSFYSSIIAIIVTFLASLEAMLNPGAKKRLAFTLHNELSSIENKLNIAKLSSDDAKLRAKLIWADEEIKRLLNHYADNGY